MSEAVYDEIADWYDDHVRSTSLIDEVLLSDLFDLLGNVQTLHICDLGCGQGHLARKLALRGAKVVGVDLSVNLLALARGYETQNPGGISYILDNAETLSSLADETFTAAPKLKVGSKYVILDHESPVSYIAR